MYVPLLSVAVFFSVLIAAAPSPQEPVIAGVSAPAPKPATELEVKTPSGVVIGHYAKNGNYTGITLFLPAALNSRPVTNSLSEQESESSLVFLMQHRR